MIDFCLAVIAICEVVRIAQLELSARRDRKAKEDIYGEFIKSIKGQRPGMGEADVGEIR